MSDEFPIKSGVRQGCPLSGTIFVVAFQPWLLWMKSMMLVRNFLRFNLLCAYADDLAMIMQDFWKGVVDEHLFCSLLRRATGLDLNMKKTCVVPLWARADLESARRRLTAMLCAWAPIAWDLAYKYLGVFVCPDAHCRRWDCVDILLMHAASDVASASSSWTHASFLYSTYCISRLAYRLQFHGFGITRKKFEAHMLANVASPHACG
jgi:hypothetical protein